MFCVLCFSFHILYKVWKLRKFVCFCVGLKQKRSLLELYEDWSRARKEAKKHRWKRVEKRREEETKDTLVTDLCDLGTEAYSGFPDILAEKSPYRP